MKIFREFIKKSVTVLMMAAMIVAGVVFFAAEPEAASSTGKLPISCYTLSGRVTTYTNAACTRVSGYIDAVDLTKITAFYTNYSSVRVQYPTARGMKTAYARASSFFADISFSTSTGKTGRNLTAYRRSTGSAAIGTVYASDKCIATGTANGRTQLIYPVKGGYKLGWVSGTYAFSAGSPAGLTQNQGVDICFNAAYYANSYPDLKKAFGYNYNSLLNHWKTYGIREGRSASPVFDPAYYLSSNSDLAKAFGVKNYSAAYTHFLNFGCNEGRASSKYYHGAYYKAKYRDLSSMSYYNLALHYINHGIRENRWANSAGNIPAGMQQSVAVPAVNETVVQKIVNYELSQLGVGDVKGNNNVPYNTWYYGRKVSGSGYAWCMAFQAYCCSRVTGSNAAIPKTASCISAVNTFIKRGQFHYSRHFGGMYTPKAGDLVFYTNGSKWASSHVGMIIGSPVNGYLQTVEGNSYCPADGNYKVVKYTNNPRRTESSSYILGYASPNY